MKNTLIWAALGLVLAGCGPLNDGSAAKGAIQVARGLIPGQAAPATAPAPILTRAQVDANPGAFLIVSAYSGTSQASLVQGGSNGNRITWVSADSVSITLENDIVVATRGLISDLMAADASGVRQAIAAGGGTATRTHETLDSTDQISTKVLQCSIAFVGVEPTEILGQTSSTRRFDEKCLGKSLSFTNTYWVNAGGAIIKSNQAIDPASGFLQIERP